MRLLELACESWDRCQAAREIIDREGMVYLMTNGSLCPLMLLSLSGISQNEHPEVCHSLDSDTGHYPDGCLYFGLTIGFILQALSAMYYRQQTGHRVIWPGT